VAPPGRTSTTVLVVEDDPILRTFYRSALTIAGYVVVTAEDGLEALHKIEGYEPNAVVLDLDLPRISGREVGRELATNITTIPVVIVTGTDVSDLDPTDYACILRKPITADALIAAVEDCLRRRGASA
jgi:two-component system response regulator MprA